jgi:hypothetical protein
MADEAVSKHPCHSRQLSGCCPGQFPCALRFLAEIFVRMQVPIYLSD